MSSSNLSEIIAVVGVSGSGKSTFLRGVCQKIDANAISASQLIRDAAFREDDSQSGSEKARLSDTSDMQTILINAMMKYRASTSGPILLDAHVLIDKDNHLDLIDPDVFAGLDVSRIVHLVVPPEAVFERRRNDNKRDRPKRSVAELEAHQDTSRRHARLISETLGVPYIEVSGTEPDIALQLVPL